MATATAAKTLKTSKFTKRPKFRVGQVLAIMNDGYVDRYIHVDGIHRYVTDRGKRLDLGWHYQDAHLTATIGWSQDHLRAFTDEEIRGMRVRKRK